MIGKDRDTARIGRTDGFIVQFCFKVCKDL